MVVVEATREEYEEKWVACRVWPKSFEGDVVFTFPKVGLVTFVAGFKTRGHATGN